MLRITFYENKETVYDVDATFKSLFEAEWMQNPLVIAMVKDVDKSDVQSPYCIMSPVFGQIPPAMLSHGVKALILMLKTDYQIWASACGDNCAKWILKIAEEREGRGKDLEICLEHYMDFGYDDGVDLPFYCLDTGRVEPSYEEYTDEYGPSW